MLEIKDVYKKFNLEDGLFAKYGRFVYAVNGVSLQIEKGETYGLVGESGCGKSTLSRMIAGIHKQDSGDITLKIGDDTYDQGNETSDERKKVLRRKVRYIFQDPAKSLDPRMSVSSIILESIKYTTGYKDKKVALDQVKNMIKMVGLNENDIDRRPGDFSGGQRQRISIARALITSPELLVCDEVVSALDVSVQSQIINLLIKLKGINNITMLFISHDLDLVSYISDRVGVMYGGMIVEEADSLSILNEHKHPYTKLLYSSSSYKKGDERKSANDEVVNVTSNINGCPFYSRCDKSIMRCATETPQLKAISEGSNHKVACFSEDISVSLD